PIPFSREPRAFRRTSRVAGGGAAERPGSVVAVDALLALVALLRLEREGGDGAGVEALERDGLAGLLAVAVGALLDAAERGVDLGDDLALAVAGAELERAVGLLGGAVGDVGDVARPLLHVL